MRAVCLLLAGLLGVVAANSYASPRPLLVGSDFGGYGFKVLPQGVNDAAASATQTRGELFRLQAGGALKTLWKRTLVNTPSRVLISPRGHVVTLDNWAGHGSPRHAVVIYSPQGKVTADLTYAQVMQGAPACGRCASMDGPFLTWGYPKIDFTSYGGADEWFLILRGERGQGPTLSLRTGKPKALPATPRRPLPGSPVPSRPR